MELPKSKSWVKARYVVKTENSKEVTLCRYDHKEKCFKRYAVVGDRYSSWAEWVVVYGVTSWVRVDTLL